LLHLKDMEPGEERFFAEVGEGILDFHPIVEAAKEAGVQWMNVEQDDYRREPLESVQISYSNIKRLGLA
jgi:sugar phosphate isomerase/epimerase